MTQERRHLPLAELHELLQKYAPVRFLDDIRQDDSAKRLLFKVRDQRIRIQPAFYEKLAERVGIPFISHRELIRKNYLVTVLPFSVVRKNQFFIIEINAERVVIATANPFHEALFHELESIFKRPVHVVVATAEAVSTALDIGYQFIHSYNALHELRNRTPDESAYKVLYPWQAVFLVMFLLTLLVTALYGRSQVFEVLFVLVNLFYLVVNPFKFYIASKGFKNRRRGVYITKQEVDNLDERTLPVYTILIPIYREAEVLPTLIRNLMHLNYPKDRLDVKLLIEEKDQETLDAAIRLGLTGRTQVVPEDMTLEEYMTALQMFDLTIVPDADVKTKPRACNYGLYRARGEYSVIFDAEDEPEPDQLKKAVVAFRKLPKNYVCLQGHLNFFNSDENLLAKWFSLEYTYWFDYWLQGLDYVGAPIPLGGTSNHFKTDLLKVLGGWDPYNVTEDADLGIRLSARGYKTAMLNAWTLEEANISVSNWIRQRSRWVKGYVQTFLVHLRYPWRLLLRMGWKQYVLFFLTFGGNILLPLINPILWIITLLSLFAPRLTDYLFNPELQTIAAFNLVVGNLSYIILHMIPSLLQGKVKDIPQALMIPIYWLLMSYAAWKGTLQLITKPFYWEKTTHGLSKVQRKPVYTSVEEAVQS